MLASGGIAVSIKIAVFTREARRRTPVGATLPETCAPARPALTKADNPH